MPQPKGEFIWFFFVPMALCLGFGLFFLMKNLRILFTYQKTTGIVKDYTSFNEEFKDLDGFADHVETFGLNAIFQASNGQYYGVASTARTSWQSIKPGDRVTVYYLPTDPTNAYVGTITNFWLHIITLLGIGSVLCLVWYQSWMHSPEELSGISPPPPTPSSPRPSDSLPPFDPKKNPPAR